MEIFIATVNICFQLYENTDWVVVEDLMTDQEKADTRLVLYATYVQNAGYKDVVTHTPPGLHAFTSCDTASSLAGNSTVKAFNIMSKKDKYVQLFKLLGCEWTVGDTITEFFEEFLCELYGYKDVKDINVRRYMINCSKRGKLCMGTIATL